jgi:hypothetical protein
MGKDRSQTCRIVWMAERRDSSLAERRDFSLKGNPGK